LNSKKKRKKKEQEKGFITAPLKIKQLNPPFNSKNRFKMRRKPLNFEAETHSPESAVASAMPAPYKRHSRTPET
jgi:hypothetical protein